jgi:hypothetical protein
MIVQYRHKGGNYLTLQDDFDELAFQSLFSKHYNSFKARYIQCIKEHFIPNCLNLLPDTVQIKLRKYTQPELE